MNNSEAFIEAVKEGQIERVRDSLAADRSLVNARSEGGFSAVLLAAYYQQPAIAQLLVERGVELDLFEACAAGALPRVQQLLAAQPESINAFSSDGFQPLGLAAFFGHTEIVRMLLAHGAEVDVPARNRMRVTPLNSAAAGGHVAIAKLLIERGADVNARQEGGLVPLHSAAQNGQREMAELLLAHGADIHAKADDGKSAVTFAIEAGHTALVDWLHGVQ
ncbi:MAG: ankyrin repeat domain-containing protein [Anaerolineales bacterium]